MAPGNDSSKGARRKCRVVFLGGLGRSGTTLLERVLGELPGVTAGGEFVHLWKRGLLDDELCGCSRRFSQCPFWQGVGRVAFGNWDRVDITRMLELQRRVERTRHIPLLAGPRLRAERAAEVKEYAGQYERVYRAAAAVSGESVVVDSSKHASLAFCLRWLPDLDLRVIHVVRDSRAVAYSWTKEVLRPEAVPSPQHMTRYSPVASALLWDGHNAAFELLAHCGVPVLRVRYEDLTCDPAGTVGRIASFAGVPVPPSLSDRLATGVVDLARSHTVAGNPMRFRTGAVPIRQDDDWKASLSAHDRRTVFGLTAPLLRHYGYLAVREAR